MFQRKNRSEEEAPKPKEKTEGKLSKRIRLVEQSIKEMQSNINIIKSRLGL
tara:strand:- start:359 stop:511 length:153 start_codon:yes stop_codon:yes gene_type:complete